MKRFFPSITIALLIGIISSYHLVDDMSSFIIFLLIPTISIIFINIKYDHSKGRVYLLIIFFLLGLFIMEMNINSPGLLRYKDEIVQLKGRVMSKDIVDEERTDYIFKTIEVTRDGNKTELRDKTIIKHIGKKDIAIGDELWVESEVREPMENTNPKLFNYKEYLLSKKIKSTITILDHQVLAIDDNSRNFMDKFKTDFKQNIIYSLDGNLSDENGKLMKSIILGDSNYLGDESQSYRNLGLAHILAVSGLHIGIIVGFIIFILTNLGISKNLSRLVSLLIIWTYGILIGNPASILRANIMFTVLTLAKMSYMPYDPINALFLSMFILLIYNPYYILGVGFQLSYIATLSLLVLTGRLKELIYPMDGYLLSNILAIMGVQMGLLPIQAYYFNEIPIIGIIANLIIIPILSLALVMTFILLLVSGISLKASYMLGFIIDKVLYVSNLYKDYLTGYTWINRKVYSPGIWEIGLYYLVLYLLVNHRQIIRFKSRTKQVLFLTMVIYMGSFLMFRGDRRLEIHFIDVGQGDSILIRGKKDYLIDTGGEVLGNFDVGENITLPYLRKHGVHRLEGVFISHFHEDHSKGLPLLLEELNIGKVYYPYMDMKYDACKKLARKEELMIQLEKNDKLYMEEGLGMKILNPKTSYLDGGYSENDLSLVCLLEYLGNKVLFTGDMEARVEKELLNDDDIVNLDLLKVPHHGSKTSSSEEFIGHVRPEYAVITVGRKNLFGHPHEEVMDRYENITLYRTDRDGRILAYLDGDGVEVESYLNDMKDNNIFVLLELLINGILGYMFVCMYKEDEYGGIDELQRLT